MPWRLTAGGLRVTHPLPEAGRLWPRRGPFGVSGCVCPARSPPAGSSHAPVSDFDRFPGWPAVVSCRSDFLFLFLSVAAFLLRCLGPAVFFIKARILPVLLLSWLLALSRFICQAGDCHSRFPRGPRAPAQPWVCDPRARLAHALPRAQTDRSRRRGGRRGIRTPESHRPG